MNRIVLVYIVPFCQTVICPCFFAAIDIVMPLKDVSSIEGTKAVLEAKISAQDVSSVKWYHNDKLLMSGDRIQIVAKGAKQRLVFSRTHASDEGHYKLVVGKVDTSCSLTVEGKVDSGAGCYI